MISKQEILNASILIVDDQEANVLLLGEMLRDAGYTCVASTMDPFAVCDLHRKNRYDLILLDLQMPGMDGFEVMEGLKKFDGDGYLPVLVITAQPDHKLRALAAGAKDFISKPLDLVEVMTRIHNMLEVRLLYRHLERHNQKLEQRVQERTAELQESEERFRRLTELSSDWYWEQDEKGVFTKVYGPVKEVLGTSINTLIGEIKGEQGALKNDAVGATLEENIAARRPFLDYIYSRIDDNGSRQYSMVSGEPMFEASGRFVGYRGVGRDVTKIMSNK